MSATVAGGSSRLDADSVEKKWRGRAGLWSYGSVVLVVLLANAVYLLRLRSNNPILYHSGLGSPILGVVKAPFANNHGAYTIDANDGWTAQALGRLAAEMWANGQVPLWNLHEGLGQPLAGEMQSAAFFLPFVLLQLLPNGIFIMHVVLELVAGLSTLALLRTLNLSWAAATMGGCLFALNGAFSVMTNAPFNPIAFLPLALLGVEQVRRAVKAGSRPAFGPLLIALSIAWMLYAGFPETALLECVFVTVWALIRLGGARGHRGAFFGWSVAGAVAGLVLAAPMLVSIVHFLPFAHLAYHSGDSAKWSYRLSSAWGLALPYGTGPFSKSALTGGVAGYVTLTSSLLAIVGMFTRRHRALAIGLTVTLGVFLLNMYGFSPANTMLNLIPGMKSVLVYKYGLTLVMFIVMILAAFGLDDIVKRRASRAALAVAGAATVLYFGGSLAYVLVTDRVPAPKWTMTVMTWSLLACLVVFVLGWVARSQRTRLGLIGLGLATVVIADGAGHYMVPQLSASPRRAVDMLPVEFLQQNLGTSRFYSLGPIQPNYGSYWGISQLNVNDLPVPQKFSDVIMNDLRPPKGSPAGNVTGWGFISYELAPLNFSPKDQRALFRAYGQQQAHFREAAVKYVVTGRGIISQKQASTYGLRKVFTSTKADIWEDPKASDNYTTSGGCSVVEESLTGVTLDCAGPATLTRRQLSTPGWQVTINGTERLLADSPSQTYQSVAVPSGRSEVSFDYRPPHFRLAVIASLGVLVLLVGDALVHAVRGSRRRRRVAAQVETN